MEEELNKIISAIESDVTPPVTTSRKYAPDGEPSASVVTGIDTLMSIKDDIAMIEPEADVRRYHQRVKYQHTKREYHRKRVIKRREEERRKIKIKIEEEKNTQVSDDGGVPLRGGQ